VCDTESWRPAERGKPRYAQLTAAQAARNLGLSSPDAVAALQKCAIGILGKALSDKDPIRDEYY